MKSPEPVSSSISETWRNADAKEGLGIIPVMSGCFALLYISVLLLISSDCTLDV